MKTVEIGTSLLLGTALMAACSGSESTGPSIGAAGKIAFQTNRDGNFEIYAMNADGTGLVNLTNDPAADEEPAWSPDRSEIAFDNNRDGNYELYVMNADGSGVTRLTNNPAFDGFPAWSPRSEEHTSELQSRLHLVC